MAPCRIALAAFALVAVGCSSEETAVTGTGASGSTTGAGSTSSSASGTGGDGGGGATTTGTTTGTTGTGTGGGSTGVGGATGAGGASTTSTTTAGAGGGGGAGEFPGVLDDGPWLIGWGGGLDHFSWVRFTFIGMSNGTIDVLDATGPTLTPYFPCEGTGLFSADAVASDVVMQLPVACNATVTLHFGSFSPPGGFPANAVLVADITEQGSMQPLSGYLYPPGYCDPMFTTCQAPF